VPRWAEVGEVHQSQRAVLGNQGFARLQFAVTSANRKWHIAAIVCTTNQTNDQQPYPNVDCHLGMYQQDALRIGSTWIGNQNVLTGDFDMDDGTDLFVAFSGGIPGSIATATIRGTAYLWR
jgi:hypothetical protein